MRENLPENGYESPRLPDDEILFGQGIHNGERRRVRRTGSKDNPDEGKSPDSRAHLNGGAGVLNAGAITTRDEEKAQNIRTKAGLRDRIGCFTWTWFTMTMATGGIANVIHSSNAIRTCARRSSALINRSSIPLQLADHHWHHLFYLQSWIISNECNFNYFAVQVESRLLLWLIYKPI